jgi:hypothetical protein
MAGPDAVLETEARIRRSPPGLPVTTEACVISADRAMKDCATPPPAQT